MGHFIVDDIVNQLDVIVLLRSCVLAIEIALGYFDEWILKAKHPLLHFNTLLHVATLFSEARHRSRTVWYLY